MALDGPFVVGERLSGDHLSGLRASHLGARIVAIEPPRRFAFTWHPYAVDPERDYSGEPKMLVEFTLEPEGEGTRLSVVESGFDALPADRRDEAFRSNTGGWDEQMGNVKAHVER